MSLLQSERELILFCDESIAKGLYFSNFYGGVLVGGSQYLRINARLQAICDQFHVNDEIKWQKVSPPRLPLYTALMDAFFDEIKQQHLRARIMFRQNMHEPVGLSEYHRKHEYFILYYQFIKYAFGLHKISWDQNHVTLRLFFDRLPDTRQKVIAFKQHISGLNTTVYRNSSLDISMDNITEAHSHDHILLQCIDVVLGAIAFRLNDMHKILHPDTGRRGKRTVAKEQLYKHIYHHICDIKPRFNAGMSTGSTQLLHKDDLPYAHWRFVPSQFSLDPSRTKSR